MKTKGFTLLELIVVVAIIAILLSIAVPMFRRLSGNTPDSRYEITFRAPTGEVIETVTARSYHTTSAGTIVYRDVAGNRNEASASFSVKQTK